VVTARRRLARPGRGAGSSAVTKRGLRYGDRPGRYSRNNSWCCTDHRAVIWGVWYAQ